MQQSAGLIHAPVLIIGHSASLIRYFRIALKYSGYTTTECYYGPEMVDVAGTVQPVLILLELQALDDNALTLFKKLKEAVKPECFIIVLTEAPYGQVAQKVEATGFISIPWNIDNVLVQVNALIGHLNPQLAQPRKGFLFPVGSPPPDLPDWLRDRLGYNNTDRDNIDE